MIFSFLALVELSVLSLALYLLYRITFFLITKKIQPRKKYIFITGAANGIGFDITRGLLRKGCNVIASDIDVNSLKSQKFGESARLSVVLNCEHDENQSNYSQIVESFKKGMRELRDKGKDEGILVTVKMDVAQLEDIQRVKQRILDVVFDCDQDNQKSSSEKQKLFGIVNNAGIAMNCGFEQMGLVEMTDEELQKLTAVNFWGVVRTTREFFSLLDRDLDQKKKPTPCVVNIASVAAHLSPPFFSFYCATKHAVRSYSDSLRGEMYDHRCRVACVEPGFTSTAILSLPKISPSSEWARELVQTHKNAEQALSQCQDVESVSEAVISALFSDPCPAHQLVETSLLQKIIYLVGIYVAPAKLLDLVVAGNLKRQLRAQDS